MLLKAPDDKSQLLTELDRLATVAAPPRKRQIAEEMRADFQAEGRLFLYEHLIAESESSTAPFDPEACRMSRYLYHVRV